MGIKLFYFNGKENSFTELPEGTTAHKRYPCSFNFNEHGGKGTYKYWENGGKFVFIWYGKLKSLEDCISKMIKEYSLPYYTGIEISYCSNGDVASRISTVNDFQEKGIESFKKLQYQLDDEKKFGKKPPDIFDMAKEQCLIK